MIVCPNCSHPNPEGAQACEACYTPLPTSTSSCPNCGASVLPDASFCGQCGTNLHPQAVATASASESPSIPSPSPAMSTEVVGAGSHPSFEEQTPLPPTALSTPEEVTTGGGTPAAFEGTTSSTLPVPTPPIQPSQPQQGAESAKTQLQQQTARLLHVQTDTLIELPPNLPVIHLGKPNDRVPPDVDVAGFPNSEVVSRVHADIRVEGDSYYIEDMRSSNGTYINNSPLLPGNRHRLRPGDRIALGKGDLVTFLFQVS